MYTAFYGLREKPFALSPDPRFLYLAASHREALAHLLYGIEQGEGFIAVTGEVGTGKTTLCRTLLERLEGDVELAFLFNPSRTALELLQSISAEFDLPAEGLTRRGLMDQLNRFLVAQKRARRRVLLIVDEAQNLSESTLEQVRLLSNLETSREKLIQILLLGQPELDRKLDERALRQLRQRISVRWRLDPLATQETRAYVRHRLAVSAGEPKDLFSDAGLREIHRRTGGIPRLVNQLCDRALLAGYAARAPMIGPRLVKLAAKEIPDARRPHERSGRRDSATRLGFLRPWMLVLASLAVVGVSLFAGLQVGRHRLAQTLTASVFKAEALRTEVEGADEVVGASVKGLPPVGANAPGMSAPPVPVSVPTPSTHELLGELPAGLGLELRVPPSPGVGLVSAPEGQAWATPAETALAPGLLHELLATRDPRSAMLESRDVLLARFGRRVAPLRSMPADAAALRRAFEDRGLVATRFDGGSIDLLRELDHPVALPLVPDSTGVVGAPPAPARWVAIVGFQRDRARLAGLLPDQVVTVPVEELATYWRETGIIVWERFESVPAVLGRDDEGEAVLWLQRALAELRFLQGAPTSRFDGETQAAVRRFQADRGLEADGVAGPLTQIALYAGLGRYPIPRLSTQGTVRAESNSARSTEGGAG